MCFVLKLIIFRFLVEQTKKEIPTKKSENKNIFRDVGGEMFE